MAKTKKELIEKELMELDEILDHQYLELEIAQMMGEVEQQEAIRTEISFLERRNQALIDIQKHTQDAEFLDFAAVLNIRNS